MPKHELRNRAYHATDAKCVCGNILCFVQSSNAVCDECGAMYVTMEAKNGCPKVITSLDSEPILVQEKYLLDPHTVNDDVLDRLGQIEYEQTFVWEM